MNRRYLIAGLTGAAALSVLGYALYRTGVSAGRTQAMVDQPAPTAATHAPQKPGDIDPRTGKKILYWHDPMLPAQRFDHPGKSPFMDMQLVPVVEGGADTGAIEISPRLQQNLGVRTALVARGQLHPEITASASVAYDERDVALVQARANGFVERLRVRATLDAVREGEPLADLYVPDWVAAQVEYLAVKDLNSPGAADLADGARQRMRLAGMPEDLIRALEKRGRPQSRFTLLAPISGVVTELMAREGMTVTVGSSLFRINGLRKVWINAEVAETLGERVHPGDAVHARTAALSGVVFDGRVAAVLPSVNVATRTLTARVELANPRMELLPGMFVTVQLAPAALADVLLVPSEAVIETGTRRVVMLAEGDARFRRVIVETGGQGGWQIEIRSGLALGQKVVVSGQFLIDSEASLKATEARLQ
ncbi:MAG: efflux RND transporter periplasmic adaptor subunit [Gammaproteobacteria bacterium]|nr:MAG: efflux RND transporter periplasmic adaptor subunit [Gammaproteobacteria bacterium]